MFVPETDWRKSKAQRVFLNPEYLLIGNGTRRRRKEKEQDWFSFPLLVFA